MGGRVGPMAFALASSHRTGRVATDWWWAELARPNPLLALATAVGASAEAPSTNIAAFASAFDRWVGGGYPYREAAGDLDGDLAEQGNGQIAVATTVLELVPERWEIRLTSHGADPVFLFDGERVQTVAFSPAPPLGRRGHGLATVDRSVRPGDRLLIYSAGLYAERAAGSVGVVRSLFAKTSHLPLWQARTCLRTSLDGGRPGAGGERDETFVMIEIGASTA